MDYNSKIHKIDESLLQRVLEEYRKSFLLTTDSRKVEKGSIFVALKGENFNGNSFASMALEQGAGMVIIDDKDYFVDDRTVLVENSLMFLQKFANYYRKQFDIPVLGISGTNGKTTTKELVHKVLAKRYKVLATVGNLNNQIGVPLTLLNLREDTSIAIVEMGASHIGDIDELCDIAEPTCCLLTNVGTAHIEGFGSKEGVLKTKTELYRYVDRKKGKVFVNYDDEGLKKQRLCNPTTYSLKDKDADIFAKTIKEDSPFASIETENVEINSSLVGSYNAYNILSAVVVGKYFNIPIDEIKQAIEDYQPTNNRSQIQKTERNTLILDCYNANPSSCRFALEAFDKIKAKDKRVFIGAMKELGKVSQAEHADIVEKLHSMYLQEIILVGKEYKEFADKDERIRYFDTSLEAKEYIERENINNALVLIKGSRATKMETLIDAL